MTDLRFNALILAGSRGHTDPVALAGGKSCKAFVEIAGRPMIEHVIAAVEDSGRIDDIIIVLDPEIPLEREAPALAARVARGEIACMDAESGPSLSALRALDRLGAEKPLFLTTADHPLLRADHVRAFLDGAVASGAAAAAGLAPLELVQATYPRNRRTRLAFRDIAVSGCNLFAFHGADARKAVLYWRRIEAFRKRPLRLAARIGFRVLLGYLLGRLTLAAAVADLGRKAGVSMATVILEDADAATDVDTPEDLELVRGLFAARAKAG